MMTQKALVTAVKADGTAEVALFRQSACETCSGRGVCGGARRSVTVANNTVGACVGDTVEVEARSGSVLAYAALVFLAPVLSALVLYCALSFLGEVVSVVGATVGFVSPFVFAKVFSARRGASFRPNITRVLRDIDETPPC